MEVDGSVPNEPDRPRDLSHQGTAEVTGLANDEAVSVGDERESGGAAKSIAGRTPWQLAWARLRRDKLSMVMISIVGFTILVGIAAPFLVHFGVLKPNEFNTDLIDANNGGLPTVGVSWEHPLGVEPGTGRDVLDRLILGVTFSLLISVSATLIAAFLGTGLGIISGFRGRKTDFWISRLIDMTLSFPQTLMLLALSGGFIALLSKVIPGNNGPAAAYIILVLGLFGWPTFARIMRGQVLSMREREFVESAKSLGAKNRRVYFKELLPNLWAPILIYATLVLPANVSAEAALSFLGVGVKNPTPTLGNILTNAVNYPDSDFLYFISSAMFIAIIVISFNLTGDGLRDAVDPKADR